MAAGLASKCEVQLSYAIGVARPVSILVETFGTGKVDDERLLELVKQHFELRPAGIIQAFNLQSLPSERGWSLLPRCSRLRSLWAHRSRFALGANGQGSAVEGSTLTAAFGFKRLSKSSDAGLETTAQEAKKKKRMLSTQQRFQSTVVCKGIGSCRSCLCPQPIRLDSRRNPCHRLSG